MEGAELVPPRGQEKKSLREDEIKSRLAEIKKILERQMDFDWAEGSEPSIEHPERNEDSYSALPEKGV
ncbi:MAG: hypothetical protein PHF31_12045, partial [Methylobacter sp.]|nr:hypothetical protein [Methylobacter sp.]